MCVLEHLVSEMVLKKPNLSVACSCHLSQQNTYQSCGKSIFIDYKSLTMRGEKF